MGECSYHLYHQDRPPDTLRGHIKIEYRYSAGVHTATCPSNCGQSVTQQTLNAMEIAYTQGHGWESESYLYNTAHGTVPYSSSRT